MTFDGDKYFTTVVEDTVRRESRVKKKGYQSRFTGSLRADRGAKFWPCTFLHAGSRRFAFNKLTYPF
jgi:hypothetical protein